MVTIKKFLFILFIVAAVNLTLFFLGNEGFVLVSSSEINFFYLVFHLLALPIAVPAIWLDSLLGGNQGTFELIQLCLSTLFYSGLAFLAPYLFSLLKRNIKSEKVY
ncbi:MAG: hypothetical protein C4562_02370 [Actinobacteria bacterium]|nr:MAG: hypothetical protein C4562_02370 [Actinomycetota bacterium]